MNVLDVQEEIINLEREIATLPSGSITKKKIKNGIYYYHRININGKRKEIYVDSNRVDELKLQIEKRKKLVEKVKSLQSLLTNNSTDYYDSIINNTMFHTDIRIGENLKKYSLYVKKFKKRECFRELKDFIYDENTEKIMILYGLRRTGKSTLIRQVIGDMNDSLLSHTAFIQVKSSNTLADLNADIKLLESHEYKYIFIDEVTLLKDFIEGAGLFSDIFAASGMKIILSGTDSLGFLFSEDEQLFDRAIMIHTTFISYREFENIIGIKGIDEYIRYGGTMSLSGNNYNDESIFANTRRTSEYIDSAIAKNIQHSLQYYQNGTHFRSLYELYKKNELTSVINRIIEDMNHRFTIETLTRTFISNDLAISSKNLRHYRKLPTDILDYIDVETLTKKLKNILEILNKEEQKVEINDSQIIEIKEYLGLLDLIMDVDVEYLPVGKAKNKTTVITQPGMRYVQAQELLELLISDRLFEELDIRERNYILERIRNEIMGRMMEEIVLLETKLACPKLNVFKLQFSIGEFDMVVADPKKLTCKIYEIKHSKEVIDSQYRHLIDENKCKQTEHRYGEIVGKYVIYRGEHSINNGIEYINVEDYLRNI